MDDLERLEDAIAKVDIASVAEIGKALLRAHQGDADRTDISTGTSSPDAVESTPADVPPDTDDESRASRVGSADDAASAKATPLETLVIDRSMLEKLVETIEAQSRELEATALVLATARLRFAAELSVLRRLLEPGGAPSTDEQQDEGENDEQAEDG